MSFERFSTDSANWSEAPGVQAANLPLDRDPRIHDVLNEIEVLEQQKRPPALTEAQWYDLLRDLRHVAEKWLDIAFACGWDVLDLFGSPPRLGGRVGLMGVAVLLRGRAIESIDQDRIVIADRMGQPSVFRRPYPGEDRQGQALIWNVISSEEYE